MAITTTQQQEKVRLIFENGNVCIEGEDYGPDHNDDPVDVEAPWAKLFLQRGQAVRYDDEAAKRRKARVSARAAAAAKEGQAGGKGDESK